MKLIKVVLTTIMACTFALAEAQIRLPPPPPHPPPPHINLHLGTPPPPPGRPNIRVRSRGRVVTRRSGRHVVRRHYYYRNGVRHYRTY